MAVLLAATTGCRRPTPGSPASPPPAAGPATPQTPLPRAHPLARPLVAYLFGSPGPRRLAPERIGADADALYALVAPSLAPRIGASGVEAIVRRLRSAYEAPRRLLAERVHEEGPLRWYNALFDAPARDRRPRGPLPHLLVQAAFDADGRIHRLLVREHYTPDQLEHPARTYRPVNRFLFVSKGEWSVLQGGPTRATNYHHGSRTQRWAYDLVVRRGGRVRPPRRRRNRDHYAYGRPVLAPAPGVVVRAVDGVPENRPGRRGHGGGNGVVIDHGFGEFSSLWHGIPGTVRVRAGDRVHPGQELFKVGNSGASTLPHIHFHVWAGKVRRPFGLPAPFSDVYVNRRYFPERMPVRGDRVLPADVNLRPLAEAPGPAAAPVVWVDADASADATARG